MRLYPIVLLSIMLTIIGCKPSSPDGFPTTQPFSIHVEYKGKPLDGAQIALVEVAPGESSKWLISGNTDTGGVAALRTNQGAHISKGAPLGTFKVVISKYDTSNLELGEGEKAEMTPEQLAEYNSKPHDKAPKLLVPKEVTLAETTPFTVVIEKGKSSASIKIE